MEEWMSRIAGHIGSGNVDSAINLIYTSAKTEASLDDLIKELESLNLWLTLDPKIKQAIEKRRNALKPKTQAQAPSNKPKP